MAKHESHSMLRYDGSWFILINLIALGGFCRACGKTKIAAMAKHFDGTNSSLVYMLSK